FSKGFLLWDFNAVINGGAVYLIYVLAVGARCARKVRNAKLFAAHFLKATRRGGLHPRERTVQPVVGARTARPPLWGGSRSAYPDMENGRQSERNTYFCARSAP